MFLPFFCNFNVVVLADVPVHICCDLVVSVQVLRPGYYRASRCDVVHCFLESFTHSAIWAATILYDLCLEVLGFDGLVLCCNDESFGFWLWITILPFSAIHCSAGNQHLLFQAVLGIVHAFLSLSIFLSVVSGLLLLLSFLLSRIWCCFILIISTYFWDIKLVLVLCCLFYDGVLLFFCFHALLRS